MKYKGLLSSKTFWLAVLQGIAGILAAATVADPTIANIGIMTMLKSAADIALRLVTTKPVVGL